MRDKIIDNISIRDAKDEDSPSIIDLVFGIWLNEYHFEVEKKDFPDLIEIQKYYFKNEGMFLVAALGNKIIGTIACNKLNDTSFVLKRMFVKQEHRGLGVAQRLIDELFEKTRLLNEGGSVIFFLSTKESDAIAAKKFYLKNGFHIINKSDLPEKFPFFYKDDLFMMKYKW